MKIEELITDVLILGSGGAGLLAAIHAFDGNPKLDITVASKGLIGKSGCTRMVQGGYNAALSIDDSVEAHFRDTIEGGQWINNQELAWTLVSNAVGCLLELENRHGCFFDRNEDGTIHQKAFAGQKFDRTVHKGDLTGIEIMNRLTEQVRARPICLLEEHRAIELIPASDNEAVAGVLFLDFRRGVFRLIRTQAVVLATGAGPTMYKYHTPSADKSCDGLAMALRFGLRLRDMEMIQFHPTGLLAGTDTRITGTIIEEGLRGAGGHLLNNDGNRFLQDYDPRAERATRDIVSRAMFEQMRQGNCGPNGGVFLTMKHLPADSVREQFRGMVKRCTDVGFDLVSGLVEVTPTAHYVMGGIEIDANCQTGIPGLYAAGEDTGGVHGANRLGGNGVGNATVFGCIAGNSVAKEIQAGNKGADFNFEIVENIAQQTVAVFDKPAGNLNDLREKLHETMWEHAGIIRSIASLKQATAETNELDDQLNRMGIAYSAREYNMSWQDYMNLQNQILVSQAIIQAAKTRDDSRGAHYLADHPETGDLANSRYTRVFMQDQKMASSSEAVEFTRISPDKNTEESE